MFKLRQQKSAATMSLCNDFIRQSRSTWNVLRKGSQLGLSLGEETITDMNLLTLQGKHPRHIVTVKCDKHMEGRLGVDWEWILLGEHRMYLGLRLQAKKLDSAKLNYPALGYSNNGQRQIDLLINSASAAINRPIPLYVFYNYWQRGSFRPTWRCGTYRKSENMLGCGIAFAPAVRKLLDNGSNRLVDIDPIMYPWSCLLCCTLGRSTNGLIADAFTFIQEQLAMGYSDDLSSQQSITGVVPSYVTKILEGNPLSEDDWIQAGVRRITVIRED